MMKTILLLLVTLFVVPACPVVAVELYQPPVAQATEISVSTKILGGVESKSGDWPWVVALLDSNEPDVYLAQFCSGVLIGEYWVLTAAHCVDGRTPASLDVAIGAFDLKTFTGSRSKASLIQVHPLYNSTRLQDDIALIRLSVPSSQPKIALFAGASDESVPPSLVGEMTTAIGWGMADGINWYYPEKLRQVDLPVVNNSFCNDIYPLDLISSQICAGFYEGKDVCNGDSGGPIMSYIDGEWLHVGLVSYGTACRDYGGWYGVYTRTSEYVDFIKQYVSDVTIHSSASGQQGGKSLSWLLLLLRNIP